MNNRYLLIVTLAVLSTVFTACRKNEDTPLPVNPPELSSPHYYFRMNFMNESVDISFDEVFPMYYKSGSIYMFGNVLRDDSAAFDVDWMLHFPHVITEADILGLKGKNLAVKPNSAGVPYVRLYLDYKGIQQDYSTGIEQIDYGASSFIVEDVIRYGDFKYYSFTYGMDSLITAPNYVLRGSFDLNVSNNSWTNGVPDSLVPVTGGKFSARVFVPIVP